MSVKQISVFVENKKGGLYEVTSVLNTAGVDIRALSIADTTDYGILRLIVSDYKKALEALKTEGIIASVTDVLGIEVSDTPGGFSEAVKILSDADIAVEYAYAFITRHEGAACVIIRVEDNAKAANILGKAGISLIEADKAFN
ncbi:MAG: acetolactate synthase [Clostridia bacterium]|nr:acetolactate synthase [Clostridia bacterium]